MEKESKTYKVLRIVLFVVIGLILLMLAYGVIKLVPKAINSIKGVGSGASTALTLSTDKAEVKPGEPFLVRARHTPVVSGNYILTYDCKANVYFEFLSASSSERILCNSTTTLPAFSLKQSADQTIFESVVRSFVVADSKATLPLTIPFTISLTSSSTGKVLGEGKGSVILTNTPNATTTGNVQVTPPVATTTPTTPAPVKTPPASTGNGTGSQVHQPGTVIQTAGNISGSYNGTYPTQYPTSIGTNYVNGYNPAQPIQGIYPQGFDLGVTAVNVSANYAYSGYNNGSAPQTVRVTVTNNSALTSGPWSFNITYPFEQYGDNYYDDYQYGYRNDRYTNNSYNNYNSRSIVPNIYNSVSQSPLRGGESRTFDVNINLVALRGGVMTLRVVANQPEYNFNNNQFSVPVR